jgi:hypothetical protein
MMPAMDWHGRLVQGKIGIELTLRRSPLRGGLALRHRRVAALDIARSAIDMQADGIIQRIGLRLRGCQHDNRSNRKHRPSQSPLQNTHRNFTFEIGGRIAWRASIVPSLERSLSTRQGVIASCVIASWRPVTSFRRSRSEARPPPHAADCRRIRRCRNAESHRLRCRVPATSRRPSIASITDKGRVKFACCIVAGRRQRPPFA